MNYNQRSIKIKKALVLIILLITLICILMSNIFFELKTIAIEGNNYYSKQEVFKLLDLGEQNNTLLFYTLFNIKKQKIIPFIDSIEIKLKSFNDVSIKVYEKKIIGCLEYMGMYLYFNRDGVLVESSEERVKNIPIINGLKYEDLELHKIIPVSDNKVFQDLLNIVQILEDFEINIDSINVTHNTFVLNIKEVKIILGTSDRIDEKLNMLNNVISSIDTCKGGELNLSDPENKKIILKKKKKI